MIACPDIMFSETGRQANLAGLLGAYAYNNSGIDYADDSPCLGLGRIFGYSVQEPLRFNPRKPSPCSRRDDRVRRRPAEYRWRNLCSGLPLVTDLGSIDLTFGVSDIALKFRQISQSNTTRLARSGLPNTSPLGTIQHLVHRRARREWARQVVFMGSATRACGNATIARRWNNDHQPHLDPVYRLVVILRGRNVSREFLDVSMEIDSASGNGIPSGITTAAFDGSSRCICSSSLCESSYQQSVTTRPAISL